MKRPLTWSIRIALAIAVVGGVVLALRAPAIPVETATATRGPLESTVTAEGKTRVRDLFVVAAPVDGELERISLKAGDAVSAETVVARIWPALPRPLDVRSRAEAAAAVAAARAAIERARAAEMEALGGLAHAESELATARTLSAAGIASSSFAEHAGHAVEVRRQAVEESRAAERVARAGLARAEAAAAASTSPTGRTLTPVRSPAAGRILRVLRESGGPVAAGAPLVQIGNLADLEIVADLLTADAMAVAVGTKAVIRDWGGPDPLSARVRQVEPGAFTKISPLGLEEQRVRVVLDLVTDRPPAFGNDFRVDVAIVVWTGEDVLTVPSTALFRAGDRWAVFVVRDERALLTRVRVGRSDDARSVIEEGLRTGDEVVVQPSDAIEHGRRVAVLPTPGDEHPEAASRKPPAQR